MKHIAIKPRKDLFILVLTLALVFLAAARTPVDTDLWWHLAAGRVTWMTGSPMIIDSFSFTRAGSVWLNHSWLSQALFYGLFQGGGMLAMGALVAGLAVISMGLVFIQMRGPAIFRAFLVIFASAVAAVVWSPRPQAISLVLFAFLSWILFQYKWRKVNRLWILPVLFLLWTNLHGGWALGFGLIGVTLAGEVLNHLLGNHSPEMLDWRAIRRLGLWGLASVPVLALHPNGLAILKIPFETVGVQALQQTIQEWASPDFHELYQQPFLWLLLAVIITFALSRRRVDGSDLLAVVCFGVLGLVARRNFGPFALIASPVLSRYLWQIIQDWRRPEGIDPGSWGPGVEIPEVVHRRPRWQRVVNLVLVGLFFAAGLLKLWGVTSPVIVTPVINGGNPVGAVAYLKEHAGSGRLLNEYNWGGYLDWALPRLPVFIDGRTDLFGDAVIGEWMQLLQADGSWAQRLDDWQVEWVLVAPDRPIVRELSGRPGWEQVYADGTCSLWRRTNASKGA